MTRRTAVSAALVSGVCFARYSATVVALLITMGKFLSRREGAGSLDAALEAGVDLAPAQVGEEGVDVLGVGRAVVEGVGVLVHVEHEQRLAEGDGLRVA